MAKKFLYCQTTEGGMDYWEFSEPFELYTLMGWMEAFCLDDDTKLTKWMETAEVGDYYEHRLGVVVRIKDR